LSLGATSPPKDASTVEIVIAGSDPNVAAIHALVRELLERDGISVVTSRAETIEAQAILANPGGRASAYIWIDLRRPDEARLYLTSSHGDRIVVRLVPLAEGLDELGKESIGQVVESSALALARGAQIGMPREEAARALTAATQPEEPTHKKYATATEVDAGVERASAAAPSVSRGSSHAASELGEHTDSRSILAPSSYGIEVGYSAAAVLPGLGINHGPELGLVLKWGRGSTRIRIGLSAQYSVPVSADSSEVDVLLDGARARLEAGPEFGIGQHAWIGVFGGVGVDFIRVQPQRTFDSTLAPAPSDAFANGTARAGLSAGKRILSSVDIALSMFADFPLAYTHFDVQQGATTSPTLTPWSVQPGLTVAFQFSPGPTP
jgi:hypothetical protein